MKVLKVLIATGIFPPDVGGPATYSMAMTKFLARENDVALVTYVNSDNSPLPKFERPIKIARITRTSFKPWNYFRFFQAIRNFARNADVIYAQGPVSDGYPAYLASRVTKKPLVVKITGDYSWEQAMGRGLTNKLIDEFQTLNEYPPLITKMRRIQKRVCMHAHTIITPSEYLKKIVVGWGIKPDKIKVIYNAIDIEEFNLTKEEARKKLNISPQTFLMLSAGRDVPWKGFEVLKHVVAELKSDSPNLELKILHKSPRREFLEYARAADLFVLNTGYEGLSNILVEVSHMWVPIITTNVGGNPEIIQNEVSGLLVPYNDSAALKAAILRVYSDPVLRERLSQGSSTILGAGDKFSLITMVRETLKVLKSCVS